MSFFKDYNTPNLPHAVTRRYPNTNKAGEKRTSISFSPDTIVKLGIIRANIEKITGVKLSYNKIVIVLINNYMQKLNNEVEKV